MKCMCECGYTIYPWKKGYCCNNPLGPTCFYTHDEYEKLCRERMSETASELGSQDTLPIIGKTPPSQCGYVRDSMWVSRWEGNGIINMEEERKLIRQFEALKRGKKVVLETYKLEWKYKEYWIKERQKCRFIRKTFYGNVGRFVAEFKSLESDEILKFEMLTDWPGYYREHFISDIRLL